MQQAANFRHAIISMCELVGCSMHELTAASFLLHTQHVYTCAAAYLHVWQLAGAHLIVLV